MVILLLATGLLYMGILTHFIDEARRSLSDHIITNLLS